MKNKHKALKSAAFLVVGALTLALAVSVVFGQRGYEKLGSQTPEIAYPTFTPTYEPDQKYYFTKNDKEILKLSATSYIVGDLETGKIIAAKNQNKKFPLASVSKLFTAVVAQELNTPGAITQISKTAVATPGQNGDLKINERIKVADLLYPLLMESSNDAAEALAENSGRDFFLEKMNAKAKEVGLGSTSFGDPSGLSYQNQSTVFDMFKMAQYLKSEHPEIFLIAKKKSEGNNAHIWFSNNQFLREAGYAGGKSGYTDPAKQTVISTFNLNLGSEERPIGIALLQSKDRYQDVQSILKYLKKNIYYGTEAEVKDTWDKKENQILVEKELPPITLLFAGDIMLDRGVKTSVLNNYAGDYSSLLDKLEIFKKADIVFANLEGTASDKGRDGGSLYSFQMDPSAIPALKAAGISVLSVANNHVGDWGRESYIDTLSRLKENEIFYTGGGQNKTEAETPVIIERQGKKIGFLGFSDKGPDWLKATDTTAGLLIASDPRFDEIIKNAAAQVDYLVVSFHFGEEYQKVHNDRQEYLAHRAIDNGARIVVGHHPHVMEDSEVYLNGYIIYSLGNFIFDQAFSTDTMQGMLLEIKIRENGEMYATKNTVKLNSFFKPDQIIPGKEVKLEFQTMKPL